MFSLLINLICFKTKYQSTTALKKCSFIHSFYDQIGLNPKLKRLTTIVDQFDSFLNSNQYRVNLKSISISFKKNYIF